MARYKVGYLIGSLAKASINRQLANALVRLAPPELELKEIPFRDLPRRADRTGGGFDRVERPRHGASVRPREDQVTCAAPRRTSRAAPGTAP